MATVGQVIRRLRTEKGWTQQELGDRLNMDRALIAERELGRTRVPGAEYPKFAEVFGVPLEQFRGLIEPDEKPVDLPGIPVINRGPAGMVTDYEQKGAELRGSAEVLERDAKTTEPDLFALIVVGNSMEPTLRDGDRAVFSPVPGRTEPRPGESVVFVRTKDGRAGLGIFTRKGAVLDIKKTARTAKGISCKPEDIESMAVLVQVRRNFA